MKMTKKELKRLIILNIPYLVIGLVATNIGEAWRLATGFDSSEKILSFFTTLGTAFQNPLPSLYPLDLLIGLCAGVAIRLAVYLKGKMPRSFVIRWNMVLQDGVQQKTLSLLLLQTLRTISF